MNEARVEHPAAKACSTLSTNIEVIGAAVSNNHGAIEFNPEHESTIKRLNKAGLGYIETDTEAYVLHSTVVRFVSHFEKKGRIKNSSDDIHGCINQIDSCTETYQFARQRSLPEARYYLSQLSELVVELSSLLHENCLYFSSIVAEHLAVISDLELKIHVTEQALKQHGKLRETLIILNADWLDQVMCLSKELERLVKRRLQPVVNACNRELLNTAHQIKEQITALKKEQLIQHRNTLIDSVHRYLSENQIDMQLEAGIAPNVFNQVAAIPLLGYGNINQYSQLDILGELGAKAAENRHAKSNIQLAEVETTINQTNDVEIVEQSPLQTALEYFFEAALQSDAGTEWSGVDCFEELHPQVELEFWLMSLVSYHHVNQKVHEHKITMYMEETQAPCFDGNFLVHDVVVTKSRGIM
ncbi:MULTISPECIES: hypothetical protein [Acinetobacter]|uniref:hypothetical protein n=1 Tax=Acinetobacter TaxID=469 RepID=UPI00143AF569|nr:MULTISPECIES: hypothetical protein [Acinetobacter]MDD0802192.1 hypothetical protein [Acinetobacter sp. Gutcm_16]NKG39057.1 hypothetical protein [Acinetobacter johnsonii]